MALVHSSADKRLKVYIKMLNYLTLQPLLPLKSEAGTGNRLIQSPVFDW